MKVAVECQPDSARQLLCLEDDNSDSDHHLLGSSPKIGKAVAMILTACLLVAGVLTLTTVELRRSTTRDQSGSSDLDTAWENPAVDRQLQLPMTTTTHPPGPGPTLFCWSHMEPGTEEVALLRLQLVKRASIFACNNVAVISSHKFLMGNIEGADVWTWVNPEIKGKMGKNGVNGSTTDSFLNTEVFLIAWDTLIGSGQIWAYDFVVKVDPDAVFFPDRLRKHVLDYVGRPVYFSNCGKYGGKVLLYGSLEVFSVPALKLYQKESIKECKTLPWKGWGEDYYMQHCMDKLGVENVPDDKQVGDARCVAAPCTDYTRVAFHDFKDPASWFKCFKEALGQ